MNFKAVCFDFDYTIGDCTDSIIAGFHNGFEKLGHAIPSDDAIKATVGFLLEDAYTQLSGDEEIKNRALFREYFIEVAMERQREECVLFDGAEKVIRKLAENGVIVGIVSSKRADTIEYILKRLGVFDCFKIILGSDSATKHKPDPEGLLKVLDTFNLNPEELAFCGDTVFDAGAADGAKTPFIGILNGTTPRETLNKFPNIGICEDLHELYNFLKLDNN